MRCSVQWKLAFRYRTRFGSRKGVCRSTTRAAFTIPTCSGSQATARAQHSNAGQSTTYSTMNAPSSSMSTARVSTRYSNTFHLIDGTTPYSSTSLTETSRFPSIHSTAFQKTNGPTLPHCSPGRCEAAGARVQAPGGRWLPLHRSAALHGLRADRRASGRDHDPAPRHAGPRHPDVSASPEGHPRPLPRSGDAAQARRGRDRPLHRRDLTFRPALVVSGLNRTRECHAGIRSDRHCIF